MSSEIAAIPITPEPQIETPQPRARSPKQPKDRNRGGGQRPSIGKKVNALERRADEAGLKIARLEKRVETLENLSASSEKLHEAFEALSTGMKAELQSQNAERKAQHADRTAQWNAEMTQRNAEHARVMEKIMQTHRDSIASEGGGIAWTDIGLIVSALFLGVSTLRSS